MAETMILPQSKSGALTSIYIAGPMTGYPEYNYPAFEAMAKKYRDLGFRVTSPHELDKKDGSAPEADGVPKKPWHWYLKRDLRLMLDVDTAFPITRIYLMKGWEKSKGAVLEARTAEAVGIKLFDAETGLPMGLPNVLDHANKLTSTDRQKDYGHPIDDFTRTAQLWNILFAEKFERCPNFGFIAEDIPMAMVAVKLSRQVNRPGHDNLVDICGYVRTLQMVQEKRHEEADKMLAQPDTMSLAT